MPQAYTIITGASRGIGAAYARAFAARGHALILAARSEHDLGEVAESCRRDHNVEVITVICNLAAHEGVEALCHAAQGKSVRMLINNAGIGLGRAFAHQDPDQLDEMLALNVQAPTRLIRRLLPQLISEKGSIINVASQAGFQPVPYMASYAATKSYLLHLSEALHEEFKSDGVHVLAVCPAATDTAFFKVANMSAHKTHFSVGTVDEVVNTTLQALARKQSFVIPGWRNKCMTFLGRFAPRAMIVKMAGGLVGEAHRN